MCKFIECCSIVEQLIVIPLGTGKSLPKALILGSTNPQFDKRLFIDLPVQYMKTTSSEHVEYIVVLTFKTIYVRAPL